MHDALTERCRCALQSAGRPQRAKEDSVSQETRPAFGAALQMGIDRSEFSRSDFAVAGSVTLRTHRVASDCIGDWRRRHARDGRLEDVA